MFEIRLNSEGTARLMGRLDASEAERALGVLKTLTGSVTLDCSELEYISSAGLGVLIETHKRLGGDGHELKLINMTSKVRNVLKFAGLDRLLRVE